MAHPSQTLPTLGFSDAAEILKESVYAVTPVGQGARSRVYRVETDDGLVRIVRLTPKASGRVEREAWVRAALRKNPAVPLVAEIAVDDATIAREADVVTMAELPGTTMFAALRSSFEPEAQALYRQFGAGLGAIHGVATDGFGLIDASGRGPYRTWREAFDRIAEAALEEARISALEDLATRARTVIASLVPSLDEAIAPSLLHGDAQPMNVQAHRGKIVAFLDFEFASGGDPLYELAYVEPLFEASSASNLDADGLRARRDAFYEGYASSRAPIVFPEARHRLYRLVHALRGSEFLSVVGPQLAAPMREESTRTARHAIERWLA